MLLQNSQCFPVGLFQSSKIEQLFAHQLPMEGAAFLANIGRKWWIKLHIQRKVIMSAVIVACFGLSIPSVAFVDGLSKPA